jgi:hypothetical protein
MECWRKANKYDSRQTILMYKIRHLIYKLELLTTHVKAVLSLQRARERLSHVLIFLLLGCNVWHLPVVVSTIAIKQRCCYYYYYYSSSWSLN